MQAFAGKLKSSFWTVCTARLCLPPFPSSQESGNASTGNALAKPSEVRRGSGVRNKQFMKLFEVSLESSAAFAGQRRFLECLHQQEPRVENKALFISMGREEIKHRDTQPLESAGQEMKDVLRRQNAQAQKWWNICHLPASIQLNMQESTLCPSSPHLEIATERLANEKPKPANAGG